MPLMRPSLRRAEHLRTRTARTRISALQTSLISMIGAKGEHVLVPKHLLSVHSVEYPDPSKHKLYTRPFENSGVISTSYHFLRPLKIKNEWMYVALLGDDFNTVGNGWIRWQKEGKLLIIYSLLS